MTKKEAARKKRAEIENRLCSEIGLVKDGVKWAVPEGYRLNESVEYLRGFWTRPNGIGLDYDRGGYPYISAKMEDADGYGMRKKITGIYRIPTETPKTAPTKEAVTYDLHGNPIYGDGAENI